MFGKQKLPKEVYDLFIEAYACSTQGEALDVKVKALHQWLKAHADQKVVADLCEAVSKRHDEILDQRFKKSMEAEKEAEAKKPEPRKVTVPDDKAEEIIKLWVAWCSRGDDANATLLELYALEKALYAACPEIKEWGDIPNYDLDVVKGKAVVTEELD